MPLWATRDRILMPTPFDKFIVSIRRYKQIRFKRHARAIKKARKHPSFKVPLITFSVLIALTGTVYLVARQTDRLPKPSDPKIVIISHDGEQQIVPSKADTVGSLLQRLNIKLGEGDVVEPMATTKIDQEQFRINIYRAVPVQIVDENGKKTFAYSAAKTPRSVATQAGTVLYPEDRVVADPVEDFVATGAIGEQIMIERATPVNVDLYGTPVVLRTHANTVAGLMKEKGIRLSKMDSLSVPADTPLTPNMQIGFLRTGTRVQTVTEQIAAPVQTINDPNLSYGTTAVRQAGAPGEQTVTYEIQLVNNVETGRKVIQKVINREPVREVRVIGTSISGIKGDMARAGIAPGDYQYVDFIVSKESGWNPGATNRSSGAYGLCQALPGSKMASAGSDWQTNPVTQLRWCNGYAKSRYGSWAAAYNFWVSRHYW